MNFRWNSFHTIPGLTKKRDEDQPIPYHLPKLFQGHTRFDVICSPSRWFAGMLQLRHGFTFEQEMQSSLVHCAVSTRPYWTQLRLFRVQATGMKKMSRQGSFQSTRRCNNTLASTIVLYTPYSGILLQVRVVLASLQARTPSVLASEVSEVTGCLNGTRRCRPAGVLLPRPLLSAAHAPAGLHMTTPAGLHCPAWPAKP